MERITDKIIVLVSCGLTLLSVSFSNLVVVGLLASLIVTALNEAFPEWIWFCRATTVGFIVLACFIPDFCIFVPLVAYDCCREEQWYWRISWVMVLLPATMYLGLQSLAPLCISCGLASVLSQRTNVLLQERLVSHQMRDNLQEVSRAIEEKNRDLQSSQDMKLRLATMTERSRIAREIHDNVGHLLTRAIIQAEAMQVVHAREPHVHADFQDLAATLHEAMDEVRRSVHDLRDDSIDVRAQMELALKGCGMLHTRLEYQIQEVPANVGYCLLAVVREALSNTVRHSNATRVEVVAFEHPGLYSLSIKDNGSVVPAVYAGMGMGLTTMESRVRALGGTFRTEYQDGFRVFASIPKTNGAQST